MYILWDKIKSLIFPDGIERTPEDVYKIFPWARFVGVAVNKGVITTSIENMETMREIYNVDIENILDDQSVLDAINAIRAEQRAAQNPPVE